MIDGAGGPGAGGCHLGRLSRRHPGRHGRLLHRPPVRRGLFSETPSPLPLQTGASGGDEAAFRSARREDHLLRPLHRLASGLRPGRRRPLADALSPLLPLQRRRRPSLGGPLLPPRLLRREQLGADSRGAGPDRSFGLPPRRGGPLPRLSLQKEAGMDRGEDRPDRSGPLRIDADGRGAL